MKSTPFFNRSFNVGRVVKVTGLSLLVLLSLFTVGYFGADSFLDLYTHYSRGKEKARVLGIEDEKNKIDFSNSDDIQTDYTKWLYNEADKIVWTYDLPGEEIVPIVQLPEIKYEKGNDRAVVKYELKNGDVIGVECAKVEEYGIQPYDIGSCDVLLNNEKVTTTWGWTNNRTVDAHITIFDGINLETPIIVVSESFASGSRDDLSVYKIVGASLVNLPFNENGKKTKTWFSQPYSKMYVKNNQFYLVTYFHDPSMMEKSLTRVWMMNPTILDLKSTILERGTIQ